MKVIGAIAMMMALSGCVSSPREIAPIDTSALAQSTITLDDSVDSDWPQSERAELKRVLSRIGAGGSGQVLAIPAYAFRPASVAVVAAYPANHTGVPAKSWLGSPRWQARYSLSLIDQGGKPIQTYATEMTVGVKARDIARHLCFAKLMQDLLLQSNR